MRTCPACLKKYPAAYQKCPRCLCYQPSADDIAAGRELIQATWSATVENARRQIKQQAAETEMVHQYPRGRRVRRDAERE